MSERIRLKCFWSEGWSKRNSRSPLFVCLLWETTGVWLCNQIQDKARWVAGQLKGENVCKAGFGTGELFSVILFNNCSIQSCKVDVNETSPEEKWWRGSVYSSSFLGRLFIKITSLGSTLWLHGRQWARGGFLKAALILRPPSWA